MTVDTVLPCRRSWGLLEVTVHKYLIECGRVVDICGDDEPSGYETVDLEY
jgi:hypothetical protein